MTDEGTLRLEIEYCLECGYWPRAAWMANEIMSNYRDDVASINLVAGHRGIFKVSINDEVVYDKKSNGDRFPEPTDIFNPMLERL